MKKFVPFLKCIFTLFSCLLLSNFTFAQAGTLDNTFGVGGKVTTSINSLDKGYSMGLQNNGKIVVAGATSGGGPFDFALLRYNIDGSLDTTFGINGIVVTSINSNPDLAHAIVIKPNDKIVVAGWSYTSGANFTLIQYQSNGIIDSSFGINGIVLTDVFGEDLAYSMVSQGDGKLIVAGVVDWITTDTKFGITRYDTIGNLDMTFGIGGKVILNLNNWYDQASSLAIQTDGKILVGGGSSISYSWDFAIARCNVDGSLDTTFGNMGKVITDFGDSVDFCTSIVLQPDGKIIAAGDVHNGLNNDFGLSRYNSDGSLDNSFGIGGKVLTDIGGMDEAVSSVKLLPYGKILVAGNSFNGIDIDFAIAQYQIDGTLDNTFGNIGLITTDFSNSDDLSSCMAIQNDGKIILTGYSIQGGDYDFALCRYNGDPIGISEDNPSENIAIFPNPSLNFVQINSVYPISKIEIMNINGSFIKTILNNNQFTVEDLADGIYFVRISFENSETIKVEKLVVAR